MSEYGFVGGSDGPVRFIACYLEVLKEEDPVMHEKICFKYRQIMAGIEPHSREGPTVLSFIKDVLKKADEKRFYEVEEVVE